MDRPLLQLRIQREKTFPPCFIREPQQMLDQRVRRRPRTHKNVLELHEGLRHHRERELNHHRTQGAPEHNQAAVGCSNCFSAPPSSTVPTLMPATARAIPTKEFLSQSHICLAYSSAKGAPVHEYVPKRHVLAPWRLERSACSTPAGARICLIGRPRAGFQSSAPSPGNATHPGIRNLSLGWGTVSFQTQNGTSDIRSALGGQIIRLA